jgi:thiamine biosynthesis lipoprotein
MRRVEHVMGTAVSLEIAGGAPEQVADAVFAWLRQVDARYSTYRADSAISRIARGELPVAAAPSEVRAVLDACAGLRRATDGYFDSFATGSLDPSGYVKGWSVQVASDRLMAAGYPNHCINAGGDVRARGWARPGEAWRIGVRHPFDPAAVCFVLSGTEVAVATSGSYERGDHVFNPFTRRPARGLVSVTVTGADLGRADAYATAAMAMGERGLDWLAALAEREPGYESAAITEDGRCYGTASFDDAGALATR